MSIFTSTVEMKNLLFSFMLFDIATATIAVRQHLGPSDVTRAVEMLKMGFSQHQVADDYGPYSRSQGSIPGTLSKVVGIV